MNLHTIRLSLLIAGALTATLGSPRAAAQEGATLTEARKGFQTKIIPAPAEPPEPPPAPPAKILRLTKYPAATGALSAYLSPDPGDGKKHPAIIWITGGDCNSIGDVWSVAPRDNDQTAVAYRQAGIVTMYPSLRGGNDNPGAREGFLGEVDDVLAAADYLAKQPYVDPRRIFLGGHSTGGTLVLLVAECSARFRAVFAFGPVFDVKSYGEDSGFLPFDLKNRSEVRVRSPGYWLDGVKAQTWVLEGTVDGNVSSLRVMARRSSNPQLHFIEINGATHFSTLAPTNEVIARHILQDAGATSTFSLAGSELNRFYVPPAY